MMDRIEDETIRFLFFLQRGPDDGRRMFRIRNCGMRKKRRGGRIGVSN